MASVRVKGSLFVGDNMVHEFTSSAASSDSKLAGVLLQLKEVRELSNAAISNLMQEYPDEGKDINMEEEGEEGGDDATTEEDPVKESHKKRKLDKKK